MFWLSKQNQKPSEIKCKQFPSIIHISSAMKTAKILKVTFLRNSFLFNLAPGIKIYTKCRMRNKRIPGSQVMLPEMILWKFSNNGLTCDGSYQLILQFKFIFSTGVDAKTFRRDIGCTGVDSTITLVVCLKQNFYIRGNINWHVSDIIYAYYRVSLLRVWHSHCMPLFIYSSVHIKIL